MKEHRLYKMSDADAPDSIKDRNGEVVLDLCRDCGAGESQLSEVCIEKTSKRVYVKNKLLGGRVHETLLEDLKAES